MLNVSVLTENPTDLHYYRQPKKLISEGRLEPVALSKDSPAVHAASAYAAVWEWLALHANLPEWIRASKSWDLTADLRKARKSLDERREEIIRHLREELRIPSRLVGVDVVAVSIAQVAEAIDLLLRPVTGTYTLNGRRPPREDVCVFDPYQEHRMEISKQIRLDIDDDMDDVLDEYDDLQTKLCDGIEKALQGLRSTTDSERLLEQEGLFEQVSNIAPRLKVHIVDEQGINRLIEFGNESKSRALRNVVEEIERDLPRFLQTKEEIECEGLDLIVRSLFEQYEGWNGGWKKAFLSNAVDELGVFSCRRERWFLRPETLFDNPYSHRTDLAIGDAENEHSKGIKTPVIVHEALHSYLPGTWTLRNGDLRLKIKTAQSNPRRWAIRLSWTRWKRRESIQGRSWPPSACCAGSSRRCEGLCPTEVDAEEGCAKARSRF